MFVHCLHGRGKRTLLQRIECIQRVMDFWLDNTFLLDFTMHDFSTIEV